MWITEMEFTEYTIESGDTLLEIAIRFGCWVNEIKYFNQGMLNPEQEELKQTAQYTDIDLTSLVGKVIYVPEREKSHNDDWVHKPMEDGVWILYSPMFGLERSIL